MSEYLELISIDFWHIVMAMGNLVILTLIIRRFLFKPVNDILEKRRQEVDNIYSDADKALLEAENDKRLYAEKMKKAHAEADEIISSATARASERSDEIIEDANKKVVSLLEKTDSEISLKKKKAVNEMKDNIAGMVIDLAGRVIDKEITPGIHENLINDAIEHLGNE